MWKSLFIMALYILIYHAMGLYKTEESYCTDVADGDFLSEILDWK